MVKVVSLRRTFDVESCGNSCKITSSFEVVEITLHVLNLLLILGQVLLKPLVLLVQSLIVG